MYPASLDYQEKIKENNRVFKCNIQINHSQGELTLTDKDLALGTLIYTDGCQVGEEFTIGGTVASNISFSILNKPEYESIKFIGARVYCSIYLLLNEELNHWEEIPLGRFNIDIAKRLRNTIEIKAIDNMICLDLPYSLSNLSYPANLYQIYTNVCNVADVVPATVSFPNMGHVVNKRPEGKLTLRDVLGYVAELSGTFAKCNRNGAIGLKWYTPTGLEIAPGNRFSFKPSDDTVQIKGVMFSTEDTTYLAGTDEYTIDLSDNPLLQDNYETVILNIFNNIKNTVFTPYESSWQGNPALEAGDILVQIDRDGNRYNTLVTSSIYKYRGASTLTAKGLPESAMGFKGSTDRRIANIVRKETGDIGDKLTNLEQAQLNATELMSNMLGGHLIEDRENGILYIADNTDIEQATKIWKWGSGGFGYSDDSGQTWNTAITADGSIVAMLVAANIITANMVQTGLLSSEDGSTWINLDDGSFNFKNQLKWQDNKLVLGTDITITWDSVINAPSIPTKPGDIGALPGDTFIPDANYITTITQNTVTTTYVNALNVKAGSVDAENITGNTITGKTFRTATTGPRVELNAGYGYVDIYGTASTPVLRLTHDTVVGANLFSPGGYPINIGMSNAVINCNGTWNFNNATVTGIVARFG